MPAAVPEPETQEQILAAVLAARDERDVPAEDDSWVIVDSDGDRPAELAGVDGAELDELLAAAPSWPPGPAGPSGMSGQTGPFGQTGPSGPSGQTGAFGQTGPSGPEGLGELAAAAPAGPCGSGPDGPVAEDGPTGLMAGFAEGGVLDVLAPGVALAGFADDVHAGLGELTDDQLIGVLRAWRRQACWAQARELAAIAELARRRPADGTPPARPGQLPANVSEFAADEVGLALTLTRRSAGAQLDLALALTARPATAALLEAGQIDLIRARIIMDGLTGLTAGHAGAVEAAVLPEAPGMTSGQLHAAVAQAVLAADPDAARRDREERLKDARVECWTDPTGTANLAGRDLPCAETLVADKRLCQIARVWKKQIRAAWKQAGPDGQQPPPAVGTDLLRARAYLALLLGQPVSAPPADLLPGAATRAPGAPPVPAAHHNPGAPPVPATHRTPGAPPGPNARRVPGAPPDVPAYPGPGRPAPDGTGDRSHSTGGAGDPSHSPDGEPAAGVPAPDGTGGPGHNTAGPGSPSHSPEGQPAAGAPAPDGTGGPGHDTPGTDSPGRSPDGEPAAAPPAPDLPPGLAGPGPGGGLPPLAGQVFLTLPLATLLGLSDAPGQAPGYGPLDPDTGRALARAAAGHPAAGWHLIITDPHGRAVGYGHAPRARPASRHPGTGHPGPGHPAAGHPADGWTITLTTERIARGQSP